MKAARLIGEVYGHIDNNVGDPFLEYRVRTLIYGGFFEVKGIPKAMRYYSIKLKQFAGKDKGEFSYDKRKQCVFKTN
ncbi:DUF3658 domain-containing protein [Oceanobacillus sp. GSFE11]|uniref:DUF3658 domain-containing protein n=1 Tax=Oceanobacillus jordanicus TaxID=2867266 RepID=A0AAW5BFM2_9BACI|nr:DUF3658 domain-containing protein [Oceanobacillus jordanicus]